MGFFKKLFKKVSRFIGFIVGAVCMVFPGTQAMGAVMLATNAVQVIAPKISPYAAVIFNLAVGPLTGNPIQVLDAVKAMVSTVSAGVGGKAGLVLSLTNSFIPGSGANLFDKVEKLDMASRALNTAGTFCVLIDKRGTGELLRNLGYVTGQINVLNDVLIANTSAGGPAVVAGDDLMDNRGVNDVVRLIKQYESALATATDRNGVIDSSFMQNAMQDAARGLVFGINDMSSSSPSSGLMFENVLSSSSPSSGLMFENVLSSSSPSSGLMFENVLSSSSPSSGLMFDTADVSQFSTMFDSFDPRHVGLDLNNPAQVMAATTSLGIQPELDLVMFDTADVSQFSAMFDSFDPRHVGLDLNNPAQVRAATTSLGIQPPKLDLWSLKSSLSERFVNVLPNTDQYIAGLAQCTTQHQLDRLVPWNVLDLKDRISIALVNMSYIVKAFINTGVNSHVVWQHAIDLVTPTLPPSVRASFETHVIMETSYNNFAIHMDVGGRDTLFIGGAGTYNRFDVNQWRTEGVWKGTQGRYHYMLDLAAKYGAGYDIHFVGHSASGHAGNVAMQHLHDDEHKQSTGTFINAAGGVGAHVSAPGARHYYFVGDVVSDFLGPISTYADDPSVKFLIPPNNEFLNDNTSIDRYHSVINAWPVALMSEVGYAGTAYISQLKSEYVEFRKMLQAEQTLM